MTQIRTKEEERCHWCDDDKCRHGVETKIGHALHFVLNICDMSTKISDMRINVGKAGILSIDMSEHRLLETLKIEPAKSMSRLKDIRVE